MIKPAAYISSDNILSQLENFSLSKTDIMEYYAPKTRQNIFHLVACHPQFNQAVNYYQTICDTIDKENTLFLLKQTNALGDTALHQALWSQNTELCRAMMEHLVSMDIEDARKRNGLMIALQLENPILVELCLQHTVDLNHCDCSGNNVLHYCRDKKTYDKFIHIGVCEQENDYNMMPVKPALIFNKKSCQQETEEIVSTLQTFKILKVK
jgi:hypothetical protein